MLKNAAALKTDSRYCDSIPHQMDCNWETFCPGSTQESFRADDGPLHEENLCLKYDTSLKSHLRT